VTSELFGAFCVLCNIKNHIYSAALLALVPSKFGNYFGE